MRVGQLRSSYLCDHIHFVHFFSSVLNQAKNNMTHISSSNAVTGPEYFIAQMGETICGLFYSFCPTDNIR